MMGLWIGLGEDRTLDEIVGLVAEWFPKRTVGKLEDVLMSGEAWPEIVLDISVYESEFPVIFDFWAFPGELTADQELLCFVELAGRMHEALGIPTICDGSGLGDHEPGYAYDSVVWREGQPFLADDHHTDFADGDGGPVTVVRPLDFDRKGPAALIKATVG